MPASEEQRLVLRIEASIRKFEREMARAAGISNRQLSAIERRAREARKRLDEIGKGMATALVAPLGGIGAALSVREVARYADAWTDAGNKIAAASEVSGLEARSREEINQIARDTRSAFAAVVEIYARTMRAAENLGVTEQQVAKITELTAKAFKAGGASAEEQAAGLVQLGQALASGYLQGDELRSIRENAPLLADAIADYFGVTVGALKELGAKGEITSVKVASAILQAESSINSAFDSTGMTIRDALTQVENAMIEYIGNADSGLGATQRLTAALTALADNFDQVADTTIKLAGIMAGALLGRAVGGMIASLPVAGKAVMDLVKALRAGTMAMVTFEAAAGPVGAILAATAAAAYLLSDDMSTAESAVSRHVEALNELQLKLEGAREASGSLSAQMYRQAQSQLEAAEAALRHAEAQKASALVNLSRHPWLESPVNAPRFDKIMSQADRTLQAPIDTLREKIDELRSTLGSFQRVNRAEKSSKIVRPPEKKVEKGKTARKSGGRKSPEMRSPDAFSQSVRSVGERIREMELEASVMGMSAEAAARARIEHELLTAAQKAGIPITRGVSDMIGALAQQYGAATARIEDLEDRMQTAQEMAQLFGDAAMDGISDLIDGTRSLSDVVADLAQNLSRAALQAALLGDGPLAGILGAKQSGGLFGAVFSSLLGAPGSLTASANGNVISGGRVVRTFASGGVISAGDVVRPDRVFASGGIVNRPTLFPMADGLGLMGEAGPEAIMPLARGPDGKLGVRVTENRSSPVNVNMNITTQDAESFRRNRGRIAAELARAVAEGRRNL